MANQTVYRSAMPAGFPGMKANSRKNDHARSCVNSEATKQIPFGFGVVQDGTVDPQLVKLPAGATEIFAGVALHDHSYTPGVGIGLPGSNGAAPIGIRPTHPVSVLSEGEVYVQVEEAVAVDDPAYMRFADGAGGDHPGAFRKSADTATAVLLKGCRFRSSAGAGGIAVLYVNAPLSMATR